MGKTANTFIFDSYRISQNRQEIVFLYEIQFPNKSLRLQEVLMLPYPISESVPEVLLKRILEDMLLVYGLSYYKLYCPREIKINSFRLTQNQARFWDLLYTKGLGEFYYKNQIDFRSLIYFPFDNTKRQQPYIKNYKNRCLVAIGGGKDSIVAAELLKKARFEIASYLRGDHKNMAQIVLSKVNGELHEPSYLYGQIMDPQVIELNKTKDVYNGHIPVTAQFSFIGVLFAILYDYKYVVLANEKSANIGNVSYLGYEINHQWSKSEEFEKALRQYINENISPDILCFSLLRPWHELKIAQVFAQFPQYFPLFASCNKVYKKFEAESTRWCGKCAKCAFVFTILAPFVEKEKLLAIFKKNLFEDRELEGLFKELLGFGDIKPFDCVGTFEEVRLAFHLISKQRQYKDDFIVNLFEREYFEKSKEVLENKEQYLGTSSLQTIPEPFKDIFKDISYDSLF